MLTLLLTITIVSIILTCIVRPNQKQGIVYYTNRSWTVCCIHYYDDLFTYTNRYQLL